uniref:Secreted protein n=1 Tax=Timema poppense TaxID=170557 RepID=A0A7R9HDJ5_TIMPO|nr:unnamed protein product [Timema poppensis]
MLHRLLCGHPMARFTFCLGLLLGASPSHERKFQVPSTARPSYLLSKNSRTGAGLYNFLFRGKSTAVLIPVLQVVSHPSNCIRFIQGYGRDRTNDLSHVCKVHWV